MCLSDFGPVSFLVCMSYAMLRKKSSKQSAVTPHMNYDTMRNTNNHNFVAYPSNIPSNININDAQKDPCHAETTEN